MEELWVCVQPGNILRIVMAKIENFKHFFLLLILNVQVKNNFHLSAEIMQ